MFVRAFLLLALLFPSSVPAAPSAFPDIPWHDNKKPCWDDAARYHGVDPWLLYAIGHVESGHNPSAINRANRNGTVDTGLMQINSIWLPTLRRHGIPETALYNACASTYIGGWVLANNIRRFGYTWEAIAAYNVGSVNTPTRYRIGLAYAKKVYAAYDKLLARHRPSPASTAWAARPLAATAGQATAAR